MIATVVITEMVVQCFIGMRDSHLTETVVAGSFRCPAKELQVHHIIDNNRELPDLLIEIP